MAGNKSLTAAARAKQDEFYTQLTDIEKELRYYKKHFKDKTVLCNCDDPFESNFFKYFVLNFNRLGLKKLIATCYTGSPIANKQLSLFDILGESEATTNKPYKAVVTTVYDKTGDGGVDMLDVAELFKSGENELSELRGDGDFRSPECLALMNEADIVVTNPPFSLFREYVKQLIDYNKKFIIRSFHKAGYFEEFLNSKPGFETELFDIATDGSVKDKLEIDLCLDAEVCLIYLKTYREKKEIKLRINECIDSILHTQMQNGRWDNNLGKTARLLVFFILHQSQNEFNRRKDEIADAISRGIIALRNSYQGNNWEGNVVTTANAITAIVSHEQIVSYKSKDFLNQVNKEAKLADSYNSLILALDTIDILTKKCSKSEGELKKLYDITEKYKISQGRLYTMTSVATVSVLLVLSYYLFLGLKDLELFKSMILESFMWIPIVVGAAITGLIEFLPKIIIKNKKNKKNT